jgi:tetratricopeptide (TPR) repeat protein
MQGLAFHRLGRLDEARDALGRAAAVSDTYVDVQVAFGILDFSEGRIAEAHGRFTRALALAPERGVELHAWIDRTREVRR